MILTVALALIAAALGLLVMNDGSGSTFSMPNDDFAQLAYLAILGAVIGAGLVGSHRRLGELVRNLLLWLVIILGLTAGWTYREDLRDVAENVIAELAPGRPVVLVAGENPEISLRKSMNGHFEAAAKVNGADIDFLIDTGATTIALTHADALAAGIDPTNLSFTVPINTANGPALAAAIRIAEITIGPIRRTDLRATVAEDGKLDQSLLGMNFISSLSGFEMRRNQVILKD